MYSDPRELDLNSPVRDWLAGWLKFDSSRLTYVLAEPGLGYRHQLDFEAYLLGLVQGELLLGCQAEWITLNPHAPLGFGPPKAGEPEVLDTPAGPIGMVVLDSKWYDKDDYTANRLHFVVPRPIFDSYSIDLFIKGLARQGKQLSRSNSCWALANMCILSVPFSRDQIRRTEKLLYRPRARFLLQMLNGERWSEFRHPAYGRYDWLLEGPNSDQSTRDAVTSRMPLYEPTSFVPIISSKVLAIKLRSVREGVTDLGWLSCLMSRPAVLDCPDEIIPMLPFIPQSDWLRAATTLVRRSDLISKLKSYNPTSVTNLPLVCDLSV